MNIAILHFSARDTGNCAAITRQLAQLHKGEHCTIFPMAQADITPCRGCHYECFANAASCPYAHDDVRRIYQAILEADLAYFVLPNYADYPPAVYFAFNERSQCVFQGNEALLNAYLAVPKRFIVVSNQPTPSFDALPQYHISEGLTPALLYLPPRHFCQHSIDGRMMDNPEAQEKLAAFIAAHKKNATS